MGNFFSDTNDLTSEDILNDFFDADDGSIIEIAEPLDIEDVITNRPAIQCRICNTNVALYTVLPCNHKCICNHCLKEIHKIREEFPCPYPQCVKKIKKIV